MNTIKKQFKQFSIFFLLCLLSPLLQAQTYNIPSNQWRMISLPYNPGINNTVDAIFGNDGLETYDISWVVYSYDSATNNYVKHALEDTLSQGVGYWIIQTTGSDKTLEMLENSTPTTNSAACLTGNCFEIPLNSKAASNQWNMIGLPFSKAVRFNSSLVSTTTPTCSSGCTLAESLTKNIFHNQLWAYDGLTYNVINEADYLNPWTGYWGVTLNSAHGTNPSLVIPINNFGQDGGETIAQPYQEPTQHATIYYPANASAANKVPVVFFAPGWGSTDVNDYDMILRFIASHGYAAIYAKHDYTGNGELKFDSSVMLGYLLAMVNDPAINPKLDTSRIGVMGHSSGGGFAFNILDKLSDTYGFGANGRFLFTMEPWFAFDMMQADMLTLPANTNIVFQQYGEGGNNNAPGTANGTDARIVLTEYYLLESIADNQKDYQVHVSGNHKSPKGTGTDYSTKQIILSPLDALMEYIFVNPANNIAHNAALELGNDDPYANGNGIQTIFPRGDDVNIAYPCNGYSFTDEDIDFCDIKGYPNSEKFTSTATNNATVQPVLLGISTDVEFGTTITRLTERVNQNDTPTENADGDRYPRGNHHPYPKTQAWNADMTMIRMNYRVYDANTMLEVPLTTPSGNYPLTTNTNSLSDLYNINGALNEKKWSTVDPNVFYGVYLSGTNGQFWKGTIDRAASTISYANGLIHTFAGDYEKFSLGKFEGNISYDDNFVVFAARKTGTNYLTAIVYNKVTDTSVIKDFDGNNGNALVEWTEYPVPQVLDWISVSPLGEHIVMSTGGALELYDMDLNHVGQLASSAQHGDLGIAQNGEEVFVQFEFTEPGIWAYRLQKFANGEAQAVYRRQLLPDKYNGGHVSCRNYQRPGWCYLSTTKEGSREVFALRINFADQSKHVVNRFAQTHTRSTDAQGTSMNSLGGVSPDGKRVIFFTDWDDAALDYYDRDTYQAQMP